LSDSIQLPVGKISSEKSDVNSTVCSLCAEITLKYNTFSFLLLAELHKQAIEQLVFRNKFIWLVKQYEVENSYITTKTAILYFDVSISSRDLHQKKMVLVSSES